jgi:hypothetical protein
MVGQNVCLVGLSDKAGSSAGAWNGTPKLGPVVHRVYASGHLLARKSLFVSARTQVSGLRLIREF